MNQTSLPRICNICQISYGFTAADQRAIIVMVVLTGIALILCYVGTLWFAIRTRFISDKTSVVIAENVHTNQVFDKNEDAEEHTPNMVNKSAPQTVVFTLENEHERF